jgi:hypothetical protein
MQPLQQRNHTRTRDTRSSITGCLLLTIAVAFVMVGCALPGVSSAGQSASPAVGVPSDVPLPHNSSFANTGHSGQAGAQVWIYTVPNTNAQQVEAFYRGALPPQGWTGYHADFATGGGGQSVSIAAQKIGQVLNITAGPGPIGSITVTSGGVVLQVTMLPSGV